MAWAPFRRSQVRGVTSEFYLEVAKGNVPGHETRAMVCRLPSSAQDTWEDLWSEGGELDYPTANETWEVVSDSPDDADGGAGARTAILFYLDENLTTPIPGSFPPSPRQGRPPSS